MKVKRYDPARPDRPIMELDAGGDWVSAEDYFALLKLARRLRKGIVTTDDITLLVESAWLEE